VNCHDSLFSTGLSSAGSSGSHGFLRVAALAFFNGIVLIILMGCALWAAGALFFMLPVSALRAPAAMIYALIVLVLIIAVRPWWKGAVAVVILFLPVLAWYLTVYPSNEGHWQPQVAETAWATIDGDMVTIHNFRNFDYRSPTDFISKWETKTVNLTQLHGVDLFINYWGSEWMAHPIVSFQFDDRNHVAFSIELRAQIDQQPSTLAGLYKTYGLIYLVGDERDLVQVRTNYRHEDIYLYRTVVKPARARAIFLDYLRRLNALQENPEFYNALTSNCTTNVRVHTAATAVDKPSPWDWRILINGFADQMLYERGDLVGQVTFADLKKQALINEKAKASDHDPQFSQRIRTGLIGFQ
jgi:hypothetical protein